MEERREGGKGTERERVLYSDRMIKYKREREMSEEREEAKNKKKIGGWWRCCCHAHQARNVWEKNDRIHVEVTAIQILI